MYAGSIIFVGTKCGHQSLQFAFSLILITESPNTLMDFCDISLMLAFKRETQALFVPAMIDIKLE